MRLYIYSSLLSMLMTAVLLALFNPHAWWGLVLIAIGGGLIGGFGSHVLMSLERSHD